VKKFLFYTYPLIHLSTVLLLTICLGCAPKKESAGRRIVRIALAVPLTGDLTAMGQGMKRGAEMAIEEAKISGRFKDFSLELRAFDDRADPKEAVNVANQIVSDKRIVAVVGHLNSGCSIPASQVYAQHNLIMISPASTNPKLTLQQLEPSWRWKKNVFRVCTTDDVQGSYGADFTWGKLPPNLPAKSWQAGADSPQAKKIRKVAVIHDKTPYGQGLAEEFAKQFRKLGGTVVSFDGVAIGEKDFKALLTRIKTAKPQALYFGGIYSECGLVIKQARELGLDIPLLSGDGSYSPELIKIAGVKTCENVYITMVGAAPEKIPEAGEFVKKFKTKYPNVDMQPYDHYTYEATNIVLNAITKVGENKEAIIDVVHRTKYQGVLGETTFDEKGDTLNKVISVHRVKEGKFIPLD